MKRPFISVIIPVYNRATLLRRAIDSCLTEDFEDFEVVVVDDASTDDSAAVASAVADSRLRLVRLEQNRGRCPARNAGMAAARGEWFVFLDSDDALLPDGLSTIGNHARRAEPDVVGLRFMCRDEVGTRSPDPPHDGAVWEYEGFLSWMERMVGRRSEALPCARASTFPAVRYSEVNAPEGLYNFNLARVGRIKACPEVVRIYYQDAPERVTRPEAARSLREAADRLQDTERILKDHGPALRRHAPTVYEIYVRDAAMQAFLAGRRLAGLQYAVHHQRLRPWSSRGAAITALGLIGPSVIARTQAFWHRNYRW